MRRTESTDAHNFRIAKTINHIVQQANTVILSIEKIIHISSRINFSQSLIMLNVKLAFLGVKKKNIAVFNNHHFGDYGTQYTDSIKVPRLNSIGLMHEKYYGQRFLFHCIPMRAYQTFENINISDHAVENKLLMRNYCLHVRDCKYFTGGYY